MAYTINKTDGTVVATITDGTVDNSTTLALFGKSFSGFGEALNENLVKLLENAASTAAPSAPLKGELWFDTSTNQIKVYDGTSFKPTGGAKSSTSHQHHHQQVTFGWIQQMIRFLFTQEIRDPSSQ